MPDTAPLVQTFEIGPVASAGATADTSGRYLVAPWAGTVTGCRVIAATTLTGADTNSRTIQLFNRGSGGAGTTKIAEKAFTSGVNATADDETTITLSSTPADLVVAQGDVLEAVSLHVGGSGLAGPEFTMFVDLTRS